jgi:hypothetical protein
MPSNSFSYTDDNEKIARMLENGDKNCFRERLKRTRFLMSLDKLLPPREFDEPIPIPSHLAVYYKHEIGLRWINGAYIATILLVYSGFDALLRTYYRPREIHKVINKQLDDTDFKGLIDLALADGILLKREADRLRYFIKEIYEPYARLKESYIDDPSVSLIATLDSSINVIKTQKNSEDQKWGGLPSYVAQELKLTAPQIIGKSITDEARESITTYTELADMIVHRWMAAEKGSGPEAK